MGCDLNNRNKNSKSKSENKITIKSRPLLISRKVFVCRKKNIVRHARFLPLLNFSLQFWDETKLSSPSRYAILTYAYF